MKKISLFMSMLAMLALSMTFVACGSDEDDEDDAPKGAIAVTGAATDITWNSATISGTVNLNKLPSGFANAEFGVELSLDEDFTAATRFATSDLDAAGKAFSVEVTSLSAPKTYYYRTYVTAQSVNYFGNVKSFTTVERPHEAVDLGLESGTLWSAWNVGANAPEEYGSYFAWGETEPKDVYTWDYYSFWKEDKNGDDGVDEDELTDIGSDIAGTDYDVAHVKWKGNWRMPTQEQFKELVENTTQVWTTMNGVEGREFKSKLNDNSIFLPAAGYFHLVLRNAGSYGNYWCSTRDESCDYYEAFRQQVYRDYDWFEQESRCIGCSVRPVCKK